jgi:hypothetical protein
MTASSQSGKEEVLWGAAVICPAIQGLRYHSDLDAERHKKSPGKVPRLYLVN